MVENVALDFLIVDPFLVAAESVNLQRNTKLGRLHLSHHHGQVVVQLWVVVEVSLDISAEDAQIGLLASIYDFARINAVGFFLF